MNNVICATPSRTRTSTPKAKPSMVSVRPLITRVSESPTPRKLQLFLVAIGALTFIFWDVASDRIAQSTRTLELVGRETAPSIIAASGIGAKLAEAHTHAADGLLSEGDDATRFWMQYEYDLDAASERILAAAQAIPNNADTRAPVLRIVQKLPVYAAHVAQARASKGPERIAAMEEANHVLHSELLPAVTQLDQDNFVRLNVQYANCTQYASWGTFGTVALGVSLLALLLWTQLFLNTHFRRTLNLPLMLATLLLSWVVLLTMLTLSAAHEHLRVAKVDAFDSVYVLWKARAAAHDANADQALYVLTQNRHDYEAAFSQQMNAIANGPVTENIIANIRERSASSIGGLLGSEAENITFRGERDAIVNALHGFRQYKFTDSKIRNLEQSARHAEAVNVCLHENAFSEFDHGMEVTLLINENEFNSAIEQGVSALSGLSWLTGATAVSVVALAGLGLRNRLKEYLV